MTSFVADVLATAGNVYKLFIDILLIFQMKVSSRLYKNKVLEIYQIFNCLNC